MTSSAEPQGISHTVLGQVVFVYKPPCSPRQARDFITHDSNVSSYQISKLLPFESEYEVQIKPLNSQL